MAETIAIDGPSGAGKSTVAKIIATKLNFKYIDTGAMYRAVTFLALEKDVIMEDNDIIIKIARDISIDFSTPDKDGNVLVFVNSRDLTDEIRSVEVDNNVSKVASIPEVREIMLEKQRELAGNNNVVMDGRDIGTRVLPDADLKIFLTATLEERAKRRYYDLVEREIDIDMAEVEEKIKIRDEKDSNREHSPLKEADDAHKIISDDLTPEEVADRIISLLEGGG
ncbi:(d)CMP kinase [Halanaerobiaceae bacterium Z-7014]|uniref:Cytidylate kinase n=1 Tax=Halonatronomonas betaini TaxID=2778430 RepID=A0A931FAA9_9FIRM|nr:(d)CMP kinase [Halonatronomonas betaini]MBF8436767.1 (d)CMP kinase [Halonatronomonas betaini]